MTALDTYFATMNELLQGHISPPEFVQKLGDERTAVRGAHQYQGACVRVPGKLLREVFAATATYADAIAPDLFAALVATHLERHPVKSWQIFRIGEHFDESVAAHAEAHPELPAALAELTDFEQCRWITRSCPNFETPGIAAEAFFMRRYTHAIPAFAKALHKDSAAEPKAEEQIWVFYRESRASRMGRLRPTPAQLLRLAVATGELTLEEAAAAGLTTAQLDEAHDALAERGLLAARS